MRPIDIAKRLKYTPAWLSTMMNSPVFKSHLAELSANKNEKALDIRSQIKEGALFGAAELLKIIKGEGEYKEGVTTSLKVKIAQDFLDREGHGKVTKVQQQTSITVLDGNKLEELKARRAALLSNLTEQKIIDITPCASAAEIV
jgi:hypothetical protein